MVHYANWIEETVQNESMNLNVSLLINVWEDSVYVW